MKRGTPLTDIAEFPDILRTKLAQLSVSTAEEFLAHAEFEGEALQRALDVDSGQFERAVELARERVGPSATGDPAAEVEHGLGALPPVSEEFRQHQRQQPDDRAE